MTRLVFIAAAALVLSACTTTKTPAAQINVISTGVRLPVVTDADMTCSDQPGVPARDPQTGKRADSVVQGFILELRNWGAGCKDKLDAVRSTWRATEAKQADADAKAKALSSD